MTLLSLNAIFRAAKPHVGDTHFIKFLLLYAHEEQFVKKMYLRLLVHAGKFSVNSTH